MASNELAIRFTEKKYASKTDVMKDLKTSLVDFIWNNILLYRKDYFISLELHSFNKSQFAFCNCNRIQELCNILDPKLCSLETTLNSISNDPILFNKFTLQNNISISERLAKNESIVISNNQLRALFSHQMISHDEDTNMLLKYIDSLDNIFEMGDISLDGLLKIHRFISNDPVSSFRTTIDSNLENRVLVDRIYTSAPLSMIEPMLNELVSFTNNTDVNPIVLSGIVLFYISMIKPFPKYNDEVAIIAAKSILFKHYKYAISYLPIEEMLVEPIEEIEKLFNEAQKYNDVTYFINYYLELLNKAIGQFNDSIIAFKANDAIEEFYVPDEKEIVESSVSQKEISKPNNDIQPTKVEIAVTYIPPAIDERQAARLENHLLELDPMLKKKEAHFYARHCVLGKMYTIQQYKRFTNCVYETARTSMEHLAELGYYRKEAVKNKFVYTPVKRED